MLLLRKTRLDDVAAAATIAAAAELRRLSRVSRIHSTVNILCQLAVDRMLLW